MCRQLEHRASLKDGFSHLPTPLNDYEIVIPEQEGAEGEAAAAATAEGAAQAEDYVEDQADLDARREEEIAQKRAQFPLLLVISSCVLSMLRNA